MTISGTGAMESYNIGFVNPDWYDYANQIQNAVIAPGVTSIGEDAFCGCSSLSCVEIPACVTCLEETFNECSSLSSIIIPNNMTTIEGYAFSIYRSLTSTTLPNSVTKIGYCAFKGCTGLTAGTAYTFTARGVCPGCIEYVGAYDTVGKSILYK